MLNSRLLILSPALFLLIIFSYSCCEKNNNTGTASVLILSGKGNHSWEKTTPLLKRIYDRSGLFRAETSDRPDSLTLESFQKYDAVIVNFNTWPDNDIRFSQEWEKAFLDYLEKGGGAVFIHASASSFYKWPEYHKIGIGRWGKETSHGSPQIGRVTALDQENPITRGLGDFFIFDELWKNADIYPEAKAAGNLTWTDPTDGKVYNEQAIFTNRPGKGRSFFTLLGHDERAMLNSGFQTLLIRATLWASGNENYPAVPAELKREPQQDTTVSWTRSDTTVCLKRGNEVIWQFNYNNRYRRPYFHPLTADGSTVTSADPPDHPWHLGLWFCWKYINGVNYWEYLPDFSSAEKGYKSEGVTEIEDISVNHKEDFSTEISMKIKYYPLNGSEVMNEKSHIHISALLPDKSYYIDYDNIYTAVAEEVVLDRTPVQTEPGGRTWGGYAGLSVRFSQDMNSPFLIAASDTTDYKKNAWVYMGFNTLTGKKAGICMMHDPELTTPETSWYIIRTREIPFFYYSPGVIYDGKKTLCKGDSLHLRYRSWIIPGNISKDVLQERYDKFTEKNK